MTCAAMRAATHATMRAATHATMRAAMHPAVLVVTALLAAARADAGPVAVKVVDIAGGAAYVSPGRAAGIVAGTRIRVRGAELVVEEATETTAVVRLGAVQLALGDPGTADVVPGAAPAARPLARPRPPEAFVDQWNAPVPPAGGQRPRRVPLGAGRAPGAAQIAVLGHALGAIDGGRRAASGEARVVASFELASFELAGLRPLAAELDVAARWFSGGYNRATRTPVFVRAAALRYGDAADRMVAIGRLRHAATAVGMLDGGRAAARIGPFELAAFGGIQPDPLSGKPDTSASRFGAEVSYDTPEAPWQPRVALAVHGSTWQGRLDERRLSLAASADRKGLGLDGWAEVEAFAADNPWGARSLELTGAGLAAAWRHRKSHAGIDLGFLRPERSLRLLAALPPEWLCTLAPRAAAPAGAACASGDWRGTATASAGTQIASWRFDAGATLGAMHGALRGTDRSGYLRGELALGASRLVAGVSAGQASFASWTAGELTAGYAPTRQLDVALGYRPELLDYAASTGPVVLHSVCADARLAWTAALDVALSATGTTGRDRDALVLVATFAWRPSP